VKPLSAGERACLMRAAVAANRNEWHVPRGRAVLICRNLAEQGLLVAEAIERNCGRRVCDGFRPTEVGRIVLADFAPGVAAGEAGQ
jgi:hypothetical protein